MSTLEMRLLMSSMSQEQAIDSHGELSAEQVNSKLSVSRSNL